MENNNKIIAMVALIVAVIGLGVGFAAFSSTLTINPSADVNPVDTFKVEFSKVKASTTTGDLVGTAGLTSDASMAQMMSGAAIPMDGVSGTATLTESKVENLLANFTDPGQQVQFLFYTRNSGEYNAYLNSIVFEALEGKSVKKECIAGTGATDSLVQAACAGINIKLYSAGLAGTSSAPIINDATPGTTLAKGQARQVFVIVTYEYGSERADGPFTVKFGDIKFNFATAAK